MRSTIVAQIAALYEEQQQLYASAGRGEWLSGAQRDRMIEIRCELEDLWERRRAEKAGVDPDTLPHVVVHEHDSRRGARFDYRRRPALREREVGAG